MRIASLDNLELLLSPKRNEYFAFTFNESPLLPLIKENYNEWNIVYLESNDSENSIEDFFTDEEEIFKKTNLVNNVKEYNIKWFKIDTYSSLELEDIADKHDFKLIVSRHYYQNKFEDKIFFDTLLSKNDFPKPESIIINEKKDFNQILNFPVIIQDPNSNWSKWTHIVKNKDELSAYKKQNITFPLLCRQYISWWLTIWVWALISRDEMIFTAIRSQVESVAKNKYSNYIWIQWIKTSYFSKKLIEKLEWYLEQIWILFQKLWFTWIANFDLLIKNEKIYFIECNPRTWWSTPHLAYSKDLFHWLDFCEELIKATTWKGLIADYRFIARSNYEGFMLDMDYFTNQYDWKKYLIPNPWVYLLWNEVAYISSNIWDFDNCDKCFFYHYHNQNTYYSKDRFMGFMMLNTSLINVKKNPYKISKKWEDILVQIAQFIESNLIT